MAQPVCLLDLTADQLTDLLAGWGEPRYRAGQVREWLYRKLVADPAEMTNLPQALRARLAAETRVDPLQPVHQQHSSDGETTKWLFRLPDGLTIETVLMLYNARRTVCISTQAGCAVGCVFCATGQAGLARNLTPGEIVAQVLAAARWLATNATSPTNSGSTPEGGDPETEHATRNTQHASHSSSPTDHHHLTNIVVMGMGEPLANYDRTWQALRAVTDRDGFNLGARHITLSTVGLVPGIRRMAGEPLQINLAVSLHAPDDGLRAQLVPINNRYPIAEVMAAVRDYIANTHRRVTFEYALMRDINDTPEHARALAGLLRGLLCHVNLIPLNPVAESPYQPSTAERAAAFQATLKQRGIPTTLRMRRGIDIDAGCGQLRRRLAVT